MSHDGIIDFRTGKDYYFNPVPPAAMSELTDAMSCDGWTTTVNRFLRHVRYNPDWIDNLTSDSRYAWKVFLELTPRTLALDLGCGLGSLTQNLAPHVRHVYALDLTWERVRFAEARLKTHSNVTFLAAGDGLHLPFPDRALDLVVLSGVLEWVGEGDVARFENGPKFIRALRMAASCFGPTSPRSLQRAFLTELHRILKPDGQLFVAIENRLNYQYMIGRPDHHSRLLFASLLPRPLANAYSIIKARRPYRTYTYSIPGYRALLRRSGFASAEFFALAPGYTRLEELFPVMTNRSRWIAGRARSLFARLKRNRYLVPAYGIVASGSSRSNTALIDRVIDDVRQRLPDDLKSSEFAVSRYIVSEGKGIMILRCGQQHIALRMPFNSASAESEKRNAAILSSLKAEPRQALSRIVPIPLAQGAVNGVTYFAETAMSGEPLQSLLTPETISVHLEHFAIVLRNLNPTPLTLMPLVAERYRTNVSEPLNNLAAAGADESLQKTFSAYLHERLHGKMLPVGMTHGDLGVSNVLISRGRVSGLIDWDEARSDGLPILDAINVVTSIGRCFTAPATPQSIVSFSPLAEWPIAHRQFLLRQYANLEVDPALHNAFLRLYWLHHVTATLKFGLQYRRPQLDRHITELLQAGFDA